MAVTKETIDRAWEILKHNLALSNHFDSKFGPILTVASAAAALLGAVLKDHEKLLVQAAGIGIDLLAGLSFTFLFLSVFHVLAAVSPSLTSLDQGFKALGQGVHDARPTSLVFFDDIRRLANPNTDPRHERFAKLMQAHLEDPDALYADLSEQIMEVSLIATAKARRVRQSSQALFWGLILAGATYALLVAQTGLST